VGPFKLVFLGRIQPLLDGVKLLKKEQIKVIGASFIGFFLCPFFAFLLFLLEWGSFYYPFLFTSFTFRLLFFLVVIGLRVYPIMLAGAFSLSKFSMVGAIRARRQTVSFEVLFSLLMMGLSLSFFSFSLQSLHFS
jgi:NADH-quinone oxidoreductase subunit H